MSAASLEKILHETETLSPEEKTRLADRLYSEVGMSKEIEAEWRVELDRRASLSATGQMGAITMAEFIDKHSERISRHSQRRS